MKLDNIINPKDVEVKLDNIWFGDMKLRVNIPRFEHDTTIRQNARRPNQQHQQQHVRRLLESKVRNGVSYSRVVKDGAFTNHKQGISHIRGRGGVGPCLNGSNDWKGLVFNVVEENIKWLQGCYVGKTFNMEGVLSIQDKLRSEWYFIKLFPWVAIKYCYHQLRVKI